MGRRDGVEEARAIPLNQRRGDVHACSILVHGDAGELGTPSLDDVERGDECRALHEDEVTRTYERPGDEVNGLLRPGRDEDVFRLGLDADRLTVLRDPQPQVEVPLWGAVLQKPRVLDGHDPAPEP